MSEASSWPGGSLQPVGAAYQWHDALLSLHVIGDVVIAAGCCALALLLLHLRRRRNDVPNAGFLALVTCLLLVGTAQLLSIWTLWHIQHWLLGVIKLAAAIAAVVAAALLWRRVPALVGLPSRAQLDSSEAALQHANQELESFMSSVSHDLRSPLTTIAGQAGLLELSLGAHATDDLKRRVQRIHHSVRHMSELIEALLALSRIGRQELRPELLDISALAQSTVETLRRQDPKREVTITIQPHLSAQGDRRLVSALLAHVLGNAWKFTAHTAAASIEVGTSQQAAESALFVRDNGAGFDMAYTPKLFKPFQRLHPPSEFQGTGIGLASAARIVERHGGKIWAQAQPNAGAVFFFTLPKAETATS
jgi:signal transduction histidine kinase